MQFTRNMLLLSAAAVIAIITIVTTVTVLSLPKAASPEILPKGTFTVELAIVADKSFGDVFHHNRTAILDYWAVFVKDMNDRLSSLTSVDVFIVVTSVTVIQNKKEQQFLENAINDNGEVIVDVPLFKEFGEHVYKKLQSSSLPSFDAAMLASALPFADENLGLALGGRVCWLKYNVMLFHDRGNWSVGVATHELAHLLGAHHENKMWHYAKQGYIMEAAVSDKQFMMSYPSDWFIANNLSNIMSFCLRQKENQETKTLLPVNTVVPSKNEQCQRQLKTNSARAIAEDGECHQIECVVNNEQGNVSEKFQPVGRSQCKSYGRNGTCFRGFCMPLVIDQLVKLKTKEKIMCLELGSPPSDKMPCGPNFSAFYNEAFTQVSDDSNETWNIIVPFVSLPKKDMKTELACLGVGYGIRNQLLIVYPCPENIPQEFRWTVEEMEDHTQVWKTTTSDSCSGLFDKETGRMAFPKECDTINEGWHPFAVFMLTIFVVAIVALLFYGVAKWFLQFVLLSP